MTYRTCIGSGSSWITPINKNLFAIQIIKILKLFVKPILKKGTSRKIQKEQQKTSKKRKVYFLMMPIKYNIANSLSGSIDLHQKRLFNTYYSTGY